MASLFISYARLDGRELALRLLRDLAGDHEVWLDTREIAGGASWSRDIEEGIDACDVLIALLSNGAYRSPICRGEQLRALRREKPVLPVLVQPEADRPVYLEAANYRDFSRPERYAESLHELRRDLADWRRLEVLAPPSSRPEPSPPPALVHSVVRGRALADLGAMTTRERPAGDIGMTVVRGFPGTGKTSLAIQFCREPVVKDLFPDGVIWATVGREETAGSSAIAAVVRALGGTAHGSPDRAVASLRHELNDRAALIVLDDVWHYEDVAPFIVDSARSRIIVTTRRAALAGELGCEELHLEAMTADESIELLRRWSDRSDDAGFADVATRLGGLPIALRIAGTLLRARKQPAAEWLAEFASVAQLETAPDAAGDRNRSLDACFSLSVAELISEQEKLFETLAVFPRGERIPSAIVLGLWQDLSGIAGTDARRALARLSDLALIDLDAHQRVSLHDLVSDFARDRLGERWQATHEAVVRRFDEAGPPWQSDDEDRYLLENLSYHTKEARGWRGVVELVTRNGADGSNAWFVARNARRQDLGFLADLHVAWNAIPPCDHAEVTVPESVPVRLALMASSIRSRAANAPGELLAALVTSGVWTSAAAVEVARETPDAADRIQALIALAECPGCDAEALLSEAGEGIPDVNDDRKPDVVQSLARAWQRAGSLTKFIELVTRYPTRTYTSNLLIDAASSAVDTGSRAALVRQAESSNVQTRATILANMAAVPGAQPPDVSAEALDAVRELPSWLDRTWIGAPLLHLMDPPERDEFRDRTVEILLRKPTHAHMLDRVIAGLDRERLQLVIEALLRPEAEDSCTAPALANALEIVGSRLADDSERSWLAERMANVGRGAHAGSVAAVRMHLDPDRRESYLRTALSRIRSLAQSTANSYAVRQALAHLAPELEGDTLLDAFDIASTIESAERSRVLDELADRCRSANDARAVVAVVESFNDEYGTPYGIAAGVAGLLPDHERRELLAGLAARVEKWRTGLRRLDLLPHAADLEGSAEFVAAAIRDVLEPARPDAAGIARLCAWIPQQFIPLLLDTLLAHEDASRRRLALRHLAPRLSEPLLREVAGRIREIGDSGTRDDCRRTLKAAFTEHGAGLPDAELLAQVSEGLGTWPEDACQWAHFRIAERLARLGQADAALAAVNRMAASSVLHRAALTAIVHSLTPERAREEIETRMEAAGQGSASQAALERALPVNLAPLFHRLPSAQRIVLRERSRARKRYTSELHDVLLAPAIPEDRDAVIDEFIDGLTARYGSGDDDDMRPEWSSFGDEFAAIDGIAPHLSTEQLELCARLLARNPSSVDCVYTRLAVAASDPVRYLPDAERALDYLDRPERIRALAPAVHRFADRSTRLRLADVVRRQARNVYSGPNAPAMCVAAAVHEPDARPDVIIEALRIALGQQASADVFRLAAAHLCLLPVARCREAWRAGLDLGSRRFRPELLVQLQGLRQVAQRLVSPADAERIDEAITDVGRWWP